MKLYIRCFCLENASIDLICVDMVPIRTADVMGDLNG